MRDFPEKGILQIYINPADDRYFGSDSIISNDIVMVSRAINRKPESKVFLEAYEHLMRLKPVEANSQYRVIYHENVDYSANNTDKIPSEIANADYIVVKPLKLTFQSGTDYIPYGSTEHDEKFDELFLEIYNKYADDDNKAEEVEDIEAAQYAIEQNFNSYGFQKNEISARLIIHGYVIDYESLSNCRKIVLYNSLFAKQPTQQNHTLTVRKNTLAVFWRLTKRRLSDKIIRMTFINFFR